VAGLAGAAQAAPGFTFPDSNRIAGADRYATAIDASTTAFPAGTQAGGVVLVSGSSTVDGLTASYVAGLHNAPILLVKNGVVDSATLAEIARLNVTNVWIVGGTTVVPEGVETQLSGKTIVRFGGSDRYETASDAATNNGVVGTQPGKVFIASGTADALAAAPVLYNKKYPLLLTRPASVPATTADALKKLTTTNHTVLGGTTAVEAGTYTTLGGTARLQGANRFETATAIAASAVANEGFSAANVAIANGNDVAAVDSLTGSVVAGKNGVPLIFANGTDTSPAATTTYLAANSGALTGQLYVFGGTTVVSAAAATAVVTAAKAPAATNQTFTVTGGGTFDVTSGAVNTTYTATGLGTAPVRIALFAPANVSLSGTTATFPNSSNPGGSGNVANGAAPANVTITVVNNASVAGAAVQTATPVNGTVSFTVTGATAAAGTSVVPVVFADANSDTYLNLGTDNAPSESFGVGPVASFAKTAAAGVFGGYNAGTPVVPTTTVATVTASTFTDSTNVTYTFKSTDNYQLWNSTASTYDASSSAAFLARLSPGDTVGGIYQPNGTSTFVLSDAAPVTPVVAVTNTLTGDNAVKGGILLTVTDSATATVGSYNIYRATAIQPSVTGGALTSPALGSSGWAKVGTVADTKSSGNYTYLDSTVTAPAAATPTNPSYYYYVTAVDKAGDESSPVSGDVKGPTAAAAPAAAAGAPAFASAAAVKGSPTVTATYNQALTAGSVALDGSDFTVTYQVAGSTVVTAVPVTAASVTTTGGVGVVSLTLSSNVPGSATVVVRAKVGSDGNTVTNTATTPVAQSATDAVQAPATAA